MKGNSFYSAVAGIGLNVNQIEFSSHIPRPVSMKMLTGKDYSVIDSAVEIRDIFMDLYSQLEAGKSEEIYSSYLSHLFRINQWAGYKVGNKTFDARIAGIGEFGQLILEDRAGKLHSFVFKEIEFII